MSQALPGPAIFLVLGLGFILVVLGGMVALTTRVSFRLGKAAAPKWKVLFATAFLQILLGTAALWIVKEIRDNPPAIAIGSGLGMVFLSGLFLINWILKHDWKQSLRLWALAAGMQLVLLPVAAAVMLVGLVMLITALFPPQY